MKKKIEMSLDQFKISFAWFRYPMLFILLEDSLCKSVVVKKTLLYSIMFHYVSFHYVSLAKEAILSNIELSNKF